jgi:hypothetical protein
MRGDTVTDPRTGLTYEVVHDFAHRGQAADLLFPPPPDPDDGSLDVATHVKATTRPRAYNSGRRIRPRNGQE